MLSNIHYQKHFHMSFVFQINDLLERESALKENVLAYKNQITDGLDEADNQIKLVETMENVNNFHLVFKKLKLKISFL